MRPFSDRARRNSVHLPVGGELLTQWLLGALLVACALASTKLAAAENLATATYREHVDKKGGITLPADFRLSWSHLGSWLVAHEGAPGQGFHDVYTQPEAARAYRRTGTFPDGTVLVKEIRTIASGALTTGPAQWAAEPAVWFVMVKDARGRFPGNPHWSGGWGWALFEAKAPSVNVSKGFAATCESCHIPARQTDWVFVDGYPTLKASAAQ